MNILLAFVVISVLGLVLGICLSIAEKKLAVEKDEKLLQLEAIMPGANCGGCGFAGCSAYAEAVFNGDAKPGLCSPGGDELAKKMGQIMGVEVSYLEKRVAFVHCKGNPSHTQMDYNYKGIKDCNAAYILQGGPVSCKEGCLHLGSCIAVCPVGAIKKDENGDVVVDDTKCIGCEKCTKVCPNNVIKMVPFKDEYIVACNNHLPGGKVKKICSVGCIGCKLCQIKVENSPFEVVDFLSHNDYSKDQENASKAAEICPQKCIVKRN